jgi:hypothetical protein
MRGACLKEDAYRTLSGEMSNSVSFIAQDFTLAIQYNIASLPLNKNSLAKLHNC